MWAGQRWRENGVCCSSCGRELWGGCSTFLLCRARISWDSCFSDPLEGEGRVTMCWSPVQSPHTDDPRPGSKVDASDQRKPLVKGTGYPAAWEGALWTPQNQLCLGCSQVQRQPWCMHPCVCCGFGQVESLSLLGSLVDLWFQRVGLHDHVLMQALS